MWKRYGETYGLKLNYAKCEVLKAGCKANIHLKNKVPVKQHVDSKYVGCVLNDKGGPGRGIKAEDCNQHSGIEEARCVLG